MSAGAWMGANYAIKRGERLVRIMCTVIIIVMAIMLLI
jgi:uncharacterized membrane protein YfcA